MKNSKSPLNRRGKRNAVPQDFFPAGESTEEKRPESPRTEESFSERLKKWAEEQTLAIGAMSKQQLHRFVALIVGVILVLALCLSAPSLLMSFEDNRLEGVLQTSQRSFQQKRLGDDTTMERAYNRLLLANGQWEGTAETVNAEITYGEGGTGSFGTLSVGMRDSQNLWHTGDRILSRGNVLRAVYNLEDFSLMPTDWNCFLSIWNISGAEGVLYTDHQLNKYSTILWRLHFWDEYNGSFAALTVDDANGNYVGYRVEYGPETLPELYGIQYWLDLAGFYEMNGALDYLSEAEQKEFWVSYMGMCGDTAPDMGRFFLLLSLIETDWEPGREENGMSLQQYLESMGVVPAGLAADEAEVSWQDNFQGNGLLHEEVLPGGSLTSRGSFFGEKEMTDSQLITLSPQEYAAAFLALFEEFQKEDELGMYLLPTIQSYLDRPDAIKE